MIVGEGERLRSPFVSRDGKLLYYTVHKNESNIWLLEVPPNPRQP